MEAIHKLSSYLPRVTLLHDNDKFPHRIPYSKERNARVEDFFSRVTDVSYCNMMKCEINTKLFGMGENQHIVSGLPIDLPAVLTFACLAYPNSQLWAICNVDCRRRCVVCICVRDMRPQAVFKRSLRDQEDKRADQYLLCLITCLFLYSTFNGICYLLHIYIYLHMYRTCIVYSIVVLVCANFTFPSPMREPFIADHWK